MKAGGVGNKTVSGKAEYAHKKKGRHRIRTRKGGWARARKPLLRVSSSSAWFLGNKWICPAALDDIRDHPMDESSFPANSAAKWLATERSVPTTLDLIETDWNAATSPYTTYSRLNEHKQRSNLSFRYWFRVHVRSRLVSDVHTSADVDGMKHWDFWDRLWAMRMTLHPSRWRTVWIEILWKFKARKREKCIIQVLIWEQKTCNMLLWTEWFGANAHHMTKAVSNVLDPVPSFAPIIACMILRNNKAWKCTFSLRSLRSLAGDRLLEGLPSRTNYAGSQHLW